MRQDPLKARLETFLHNELLFEETLSRVYKTQVVFKHFLQELSSEIARTLGKNDPSLAYLVHLELLSHRFREKLFAVLAKVAQG